MSGKASAVPKVLPFPRARQLAPARRSREDMAFLPAALEIVETPASPAGRATALCIAAATVVAIAWACIGQVDIIATAPGQIVPVGRSKTVQPPETAVVRAIHVDDGAHVRAGEPLIELNTTQSEADRDRFARDLMQAELDRARLAGLRQAWLANAAPALIEPSAAAGAVQLEATAAAMQAQFAEQAAKLAALEQQIAEKQAEGDEATASLAKVQASLPWSEQQADLRRQLKDMQFGNKLAWLEAEQHAIEQRHDLAVYATKQAEAAAARSALERQRAQMVAEYQKGVLTDLVKAEDQAGQARQELIKATERTRLLTLRAPIDGTVQQLAVHTVGGVVTPAQPVLVVAPDNPGLLVEAHVENKDVGFVHAGQDVEIKVETFLFTRYGLIRGTVLDLSRDAVAANDPAKPAGNKGEEKGANDTAPAGSAAYVAHVALGQTAMMTENGLVPLEAGMSVTAEIKTGRRRVISYLLSPLQRYANEGLRER
ncbi:MAG: HlyD family type I secretion periplasmic adaptor subunit [Chthoniobacter sp.]|nr:HlyD family type I secretion periplasmic adaptor subunit [Chthoniobacter sp.]